MSEKFHSSILKLFEVCKNIQAAKDATNLKLVGGKKVNPIMKYFNNYVKVYNKTEAGEHIADVIAMFTRHRGSLLRGGDDDTWLREKGVVLQYSDGLKATQDIKIMFSAFYTSAIQVKETVEKQLEGLGQEAFEDRVELLYPDILRLNLYRIIHEALKETSGKEKDCETLGAIIRELEKDLGIDEETTPDTKSTAGGGDFSLQGLLQGAVKIAKDQGVISSDASIPTENDLGGMLQRLLGDPRIKETFGGIIGELQTAKTPDQLICKFGETLKKLGPVVETAAKPTEDAPSTAEDKPLIDV